MSEQDKPTRDEIRDLVNECGLDWHRGFAPLFDGDDTNRYEVLVRAAIAADRAARPVLTDEQIDAITDQQWGKGCVPSQYKAHRAYARAVLAAAQGSKP